jgi:hypothetical protein
MQPLHRSALMPSRALGRGLIGGLAAGAVVALWFLIVDLATAGAFHTPTVLARTLLGDPGATASVALVTTYTVLHFGVFALLGMAAAWFIAVLGVSPSLRLGALFGVGVLTAVYYGAFLVTGANVLSALPPVQVLLANLVGGMALVAYLHHATQAETPLGLGVLREHPVLAAGLVTGFVGAATVALWFLVLDVLRNAPFYTPAALGSVLFFGATSPDDVRVTLGVVAAYTVLHLAAFAVAGVAIVWGVERLQRTPSMWLMAILVLIMLEALFLGTVGSLSEWVLGAVGYWAVGIGNLLAVIAMGWWVWRTHPELRHQILEVPADTRV